MICFNKTKDYHVIVSYILLHFSFEHIIFLFFCVPFEHPLKHESLPKRGSQEYFDHNYKREIHLSS